ncbi:hypothetical protein HMN09_00960200 [Mycena chlorophos]|uniref:Uncharacterized protein n=1 Tax=Mycena chlorophos TaxID=658473 RepID=A0A8H6SIT2_MYCCL|nr:hypothetical protein HMN09_00960200 [Mycena chlorophos]
MAAASHVIVVDDMDPRIIWHCPVVKERHLKGSYFRDSWTAPDSLSCGMQLGWFSFTFNGTQVSIAAADSAVNSQYSVSIDGGPFKLQTGTGPFTSANLTDGLHTITYSSGNTSLYPALDYLTFVAGASTQLFSESVIVDDSNSQFNFSGSWSTTAISEALNLRPSAIYLNTTHWAGATGDAFTFNFQGDSIAVYGLIPSVEGNSTIACSLDAGSANSTLLPYGTVDPQPMVELCRIDDVPAGAHTLKLNFTHIAPSHMYGVDFVVYNSTVHTTPVTPGTALQQESSSTNEQKTHIIEASTVGAIAALVLLLVALVVIVVCRRRRPRRSPKLF